MPRIPISDLPFAIEESCLIKLISDYLVGSIEHHLNDPFVLNREVELPPQTGCNIDTSITSIESAPSPNLGVVSKEVPHSKKDIRC
jgi:hypothetical protein